MTVRFVRAIGVTLLARLASAFLSFVVFADVAASLSHASAAKVFFFSFAFGFSVSSLRTFHLIASKVSGNESRTDRLRRVRTAALTLSRLSIFIGPGVLLLLLAQGLSWLSALAGAMLVLAGSHDLDLPRAVVGRTPLLPWLTAAGGMVGIICLYWIPQTTESLAVAALLAPWGMVAAYRIAAGRRLLRSRVIRVTAEVPRSRRVAAGPLIFAVFDGAILNAPFILALPLSPSSAVDLALGNRIYVASLALYSLISSWAVSGDIHRWSLRLPLGAPALFAVAQILAALPIGLLYAEAYAMIASDRVSFMALLTFIAQLGSYTLFITTIRFGATAAQQHAAALFGLVLVTFYAVAVIARWILPPEALGVPEILTAVVAALVLPTMFLIWNQCFQRVR
jgi:hypothetical protein